MRFFSVKYFWILLILPLIIVFFIYAYKDVRKKLKLFYGDLYERLIPKNTFPLLRLRIVVSLLVIVFIIFALARPQLGYKWIDRGNINSDVILALDMSTSMLAEDVYPNRLEYAKREILDFLSVVSGDRVGLIVFAGYPYLVCPLTTDYASLRSYVNDIDINMLSSVGTAFDKMIMKAADSFDLESTASKTLIIFSDGEDHSQNALSVASDVAKYGIKICSIPIGSEKGALIPIEKGTFKKDKNGEAVVTKVNINILEDIADVSGGVVEIPSNENFDMQRFYTEVVRGEDIGTKFFVSKVRIWNERYRWFLLPAIILLFIEFFFDGLVNFFFRDKNKIFLLFLLLIFFTPSFGNCAD
ncbi:MAG: VWA domain-containing protein, partial [Candidatus Schekmanbacteria bacterium]